MSWPCHTSEEARGLVTWLRSLERALLLGLSLSLLAACSRTQPPAQVAVVAEFVDAAARGSYESAYRITTPSYQREVSFEQFRQALSVSVFLGEAKGFRATAIRKERRAYVIEGMLRSGGEVPCTAVVERVDGRWYLSDLRAPAEQLLPLGR